MHCDNPELDRLIAAFETEAGRFHDLQFHTMFVTEQGPSMTRQFAPTNHAIMLWQYYGKVRTDSTTEQLVQDLQSSNLQWGVRGAKLSMFGILEGETCNLFQRMAERAAAVFNNDQIREIQSRVVLDIMESDQIESSSGKPLAAINHNALSIWLNYLLYHVSMTNPGRERWQKITPDPFTLSLLALERFKTDRTIGKIDRSGRDIANINFKVALSFPGAQRGYVSKVAERLRASLEPDTVFYDHDYQAQLARPNLDILLQNLYGSRSQLIVAFLSKDYARKEWCGLEWRALRDIIKKKQDARIMFIRLDDAQVDGTFSIDGAVDARALKPQIVAELILERLRGISGTLVQQ